MAGVHDLVVGTGRAMLTVEQYATVGDYRAEFGSSDDIAECGHGAGRTLAQDPIQAAK